MNTRRKGLEFENIAVAYLKKQGIKVIARNLKSYRGAEIDIIGLDADSTIVFIEVKYRKSAKNGHPAESVTKQKMKSISFAADYFLAHFGIADSASFRFDVIAITGSIAAPEISWYKNAFDYTR